jgi:hypothetical protein
VVTGETYMILSATEVNTLKTEFTKAMNDGHPEQRYQRFIEENTSLVPREFVQNHGVHLDLVLRKPFLANDYSPDFFYMSKSSQDWNLVLVEIEKPQSKYFKNGSNDIHPDFNAGLDQIARSRAWFENNANRSGFINGTIEALMVPHRDAQQSMFC